MAPTRGRLRGAKVSGEAEAVEADPNKKTCLCPGYTGVVVFIVIMAMLIGLVANARHQSPEGHEALLKRTRAIVDGIPLLATQGMDAQNSTNDNPVYVGHVAQQAVQEDEREV